MSEINGFYTMKGYDLNTNKSTTSAMEDYLEMMLRILEKRENVRVSDLSKQLHVKKSSVTKMVQQLVEGGLVHAEKYGDILLTEEGENLGKYLLYRHDVIQKFLCLLNGTDDELEQVERIEHYLDERTVKNLESLTQYIGQIDGHQLRKYNTR